MLHRNATVLHRRTLFLTLVALILLCVYVKQRREIIWSSRNENLSSVRFKSSSCTNKKGVLFQSKLRHAIVVDAGSTGSRIHVYSFATCDTLPIGVHAELFKESKPGLATLSPEKGAESIRVLMEEAIRFVPEHEKSCTPVILKATAGLRLLSDNGAKVRLDLVKETLKRLPFPLLDEERSVEVMSGSDEGIFAWMTVNFLSGKAAVVMDLGGASTQIAYEVDGGIEEINTELQPFFSQISSSVGDKETIKLYRHSYLGFGLMEARKLVKSQFLKKFTQQQQQQQNFMCFPSFYSETINNVTLLRIKAPDNDEKLWDACSDEVKRIFDFEAPCNFSHCSFNGVYHPLSGDALVSRAIYAFSYIYDRTSEIGIKEAVTLKEYQEAASGVCNDPKKHSDLLKANPHLCLDLVYIYQLLRYGYKIPEEKQIILAKKIKEIETGWALGSALDLLSQPASKRLQCKATNVGFE